MTNTNKIRELNDEARRLGSLKCRVVMTHTLAHEPPDVQKAIWRAVQTFDAFTTDNDPHREHDCAIAQVPGFGPVLWKFDYYDLALEYHSEDASDPQVTKRVLTLMRPEEY